jgi:hypothetical protein
VHGTFGGFYVNEFAEARGGATHGRSNGSDRVAHDPGAGSCFDSTMGPWRVDDPAVTMSGGHTFSLNPPTSVPAASTNAVKCRPKEEVLSAESCNSLKERRAIHGGAFESDDDRSR